MPELLWLYLTALLHDRTSSSCVALAEALETVSHDRLTRLLQAEWSGQTLLELAYRMLFVQQRGYLILDDTVIPKPFASTMEGLAWASPARNGGLCMASPWCCSCGPMGGCEFPWACDSGVEGDLRSTSWPCL
jgi:hypothetical protein